MQRSAMLVALSIATASCSAADAELARMQEVPLVVSIDEAGVDVLAYDPAVTTPVDTTAPDLFVDLPSGETTVPSTDGESTPGGDDEPQTTEPMEENPAADPPPTDGATPIVQPTVLQRFPHDANAFTQGLVYADGVLFESTGLLGESSRRRVAPTTGEVITSARLDADLFGAGLALADGQLIQLTWQQGIAIVADPTTMLEVSRFSYEGEGWGLCQLDEETLVMSNGSGFLTVRDRSTFAMIGEIEVTVDGAPTTNLNELECVGESIYANVWLESDILEIDASSGRVRRIVDAGALVPGDVGPDDVLNGIAYRPESDTFFLTGKRWTVMYEVSLG